MPEHSQLTHAETHEPRHIGIATLADAGKVITPSATEAGLSVLRLLASSEITYDPTASGLTAETVKAALDEIVELFSDAANLSYDNSTSALAAEDVQAAVDELADRDELQAQADIADLSQLISDPPTQAEVQEVQDKVNAILGALRSAGVLN